MSDPYPEPLRRSPPASSRHHIAMDYSPTARINPLPPSNPEPSPTALEPTLRSLARAAAAFERGGDHDAALALLDHLKLILAGNSRPEASRMMQEARASLDPMQASDIAVAEREVTYAILRMEAAAAAAIEGMPTISTTHTAWQMHLGMLVELRAVYSRQHLHAVNGNRGCI